MENAYYNITLDSLVKTHHECNQNSVQVKSHISNPLRVELSENRRSLSITLEDVSRNFYDVVSSLRVGFSDDSMEYCGETELRIINNRDDVGSPFSFVMLDDTSQTLEIWCDHP